MSGFPKIVSFPYADKIVHLLMYGAFAASIAFDNRKSILLKKKHPKYAAILFPVIFGGIVEILQEQFFYPRSAEWIDWFADIIGAIIGFFFIYIVLFYQDKLRANE